MPRSPERLYDQHRKDAERVEKAQSAYDKHLEEAREAGDLTKHPELWDQASAEYQAEAKEKIAEAVKAGNYDVAEELIRGLRAHLDTNKEIEERAKREGLNKDEWELLQDYRKGIQSLIDEISDPLTKKKIWRKSALLFDKTGSMEYSVQQQLIECALLAIELEKAANQKSVKFSISSFRNPKEMTQYKTLDQKVDAHGAVQIIKQLERRDGEGPTEEAEHLEKVFAELSAQGEKDGEEYPKDIIYFTDGETSSPQRTREVLKKIGQLVNVEVVLTGGESEVVAGFYKGIPGVQVTLVPRAENLPAAFGEIIKAKYAPELLVGDKAEISETEARAKAKENIEKMTKIEPREKIRRMVSEADWQHAKDKALGMLQSGFQPGYWAAYTLNQLAEMRKFDPERFDKEIEVTGHSWQRLMEEVEREEGYPGYYLLSMCDLKAVNPKLFEEQFWNRIDSSHKENNWKRIMVAVRQSKNYPREFLRLASAVKDLDPERFQQEIGVSEEFTSVIWPQIVKEVERMRERYPEYFAMAAGMAQSIKPENEPDITMDEKTWNELKKELDYTLHNKVFRTFFSMANNASRLKVEKK